MGNTSEAKQLLSLATRLQEPSRVVLFEIYLSLKMIDPTLHSFQVS